MKKDDFDRAKELVEEIKRLEKNYDFIENYLFYSYQLLYTPVEGAGSTMFAEPIPDNLFHNEDFQELREATLRRIQERLEQLCEELEEI